MTKQFARQVDGRPEVLSAPIRLRWAFDDLVTTDGHRLMVVFGCGMKSLPEPAERKLFLEVFMTGNDAVTATDLIAHFTPVLRGAATSFAIARKAESVLSEDARAEWVATLRKAADEIAFSCGLEVLPPFDMDVTSPTLQQERLDQMQRTAAERRSADRVGHLSRAADLLKQWESLKTSVPSITPGKLLEQLNPTDRGAMLDTLLMASGAAGANTSLPDLWAVAGPYLIRIEMKPDSPQPTLIPLPTTAGPLRSVLSTDRKLLAGARSGVMLIDPSSPGQAEIYLQSDLVSEHGFSSVAIANDRIWATHRDGGLVCWMIGQTQKPAMVISPAAIGGEARHLIRAHRGNLLFASGSKLMAVDSAGQISTILLASSAIVSLLKDGDQTIVICEDGAVISLDSQLHKTGDDRFAGRIVAAALLPWLSSYRLLLSRADAPIDCVGLDDQLITQFGGGHTGLRAVCACGSKVAAMSADRQRIILWNPWDGRRPAAEIYVPGLARHRVADIAFGD